MLEAELAFTKDLNVVMDVVEESLKHTLRGLADMEADLLALRRSLATGWEGKEPVVEETITLPWKDVIDKPWQRMTYTEAIQLLPDGPAWGDPLSSDHEKWLANHANGPIFITDYPTPLKPFYMRGNSSSAEGTVSCFDLLVPGIGELVGGSVREERLAHLESAMKKHGLSVEEYGWYLDLRRYGSVPHGGFGIGFERLISWISGIENVRECIAFPRWAGRMAG